MGLELRDGLPLGSWFDVPDPLVPQNLAFLQKAVQGAFINTLTPLIQVLSGKAEESQLFVNEYMMRFQEMLLGVNFTSLLESVAYKLDENALIPTRDIPQDIDNYFAQFKGLKLAPDLLRVAAQQWTDYLSWWNKGAIAAILRGFVETVEAQLWVLARAATGEEGNASRDLTELNKLAEEKIAVGTMDYAKARYQYYVQGIETARIPKMKIARSSLGFAWNVLKRTAARSWRASPIRSSLQALRNGVASAMGWKRRLPRPKVWKPISLTAACEINYEGILRTFGGEGFSLTSCQDRCIQTTGCVAIDFYVSSGWCNLFDVACTQPQRRLYGASSYLCE